MKPIPVLARILVAGACAMGVGCAANTTAVGTLETELRRLRTEQEHQAQQIEMLQNRVILTEDTARQARNAMLGVTRRQTVHLGTEPAPTETIPVDVTGTSDDPGADASTGAPGTELPRVRMSGAERIPERPPFVVHESDRLPVVPIPPVPTVSPGVPATAVPTAPPAGIPVPGPSGSTGASGHSSRRPSGGRAEHALLQDATPGYAPETPTAPPGMGPAVVAGTGVLDARAATAYDAALALARGGRCTGTDGALEAFAAFLVRWPDHPHADNAMYWRGECFAREGDSRRALTEWDGLLARFPVGNKVPDALYTMAVTYRRLGDSSAAERAAQRLMNEHPDSDAARRMRAERQRP